MERFKKDSLVMFIDFLELLEEPFVKEIEIKIKSSARRGTG